MRSNEQIDEAVKEGYNLDYYRTAIAKIVGDDHPHLELLAQLTPAIVLHRTVFTPEQIDVENMTEEIISFILSLNK